MTRLAEVRKLLTAEAGRLYADAARLTARGFPVLAGDLRGIANRLTTVAAHLSKWDLP